MPLQQANSELSEKSGMLQAEKKILEEDIKRWKARTQVSEKTRRRKAVNDACKKGRNISFFGE